jgi:hypothetical protein
LLKPHGVARDPRQVRRYPKDEMGSAPTHLRMSDRVEIANDLIHVRGNSLELASPEEGRQAQDQVGHARAALESSRRLQRFGSSVLLQVDSPPEPESQSNAPVSRGRRQSSEEAVRDGLKGLPP